MIYELRQYTMVPGCRDAFADYFDRHFVESQEELGIRVIGQFRDMDRADRYVWMRAYPDMAGRGRMLTAFYDGPYWAANKEPANAMMSEWHDVLLLQPAWVGSGPALDGAVRGAIGVEAASGEGLTATIWRTRKSQLPELTSAYRNRFPDALTALVTEPSANNFPRHPVRDKETVLVGIRRGMTSEAQKLDGAGEPIQTIRLMPTARSLLR